MRATRATWRRKAAFALLGLAVCGNVLAQAWPSKPIRMIVNFPAGGVVDVIARLVSPGLSESLGQQVVVENRPGAGGNIGADAVAKSAGDGYTLLMSSGGTISINPVLYSKMPFDPTKDLQPVAAAARVLVFLVVRPDLPPRDIKSFIDYARANPGKLSYGSPGNGSSPHLAGEMFKSAARFTPCISPIAAPRPPWVTFSATSSTSCSTPALAWPMCAAANCAFSRSAAPSAHHSFPTLPRSPKPA